MDENVEQNTNSFDTLGIHSTGLLQNIAGLGFSTATQIQSEVIPLALEGRDVSGLSRTGTGKTGAFLIPLIDRLLQMPETALALCLSPTRELAMQIETESKKLCRNLPIRGVCTVGGMPVQDQIREISTGARIVIGTPGRVLDLMRTGALDPKQVGILVFDEADRMFDMGFIDDMRIILERVNPARQILLFSATMNFSVLNMMYEFKCDPVEINVSKDQLTADGIAQMIYHVGESEKPAYLVKFCKEAQEGGIIIFVNYREKVLWVADLLQANGIPATGISSLLRQDRRNRIIADFRKGKFRALVATDVASRGIDVDGVALVVNYQLPDEAANYVHRIGRTARAGRSGQAISIAGPEDGYNQLRIEEFLGNKIPVGWLNPEQIDLKVQLPGRYRRENREFQGKEDRKEPMNTEGNTPETTTERAEQAPRAGRNSSGRFASRNNSGPRNEPREIREPREPRRDNRTENRPAPADRPASRPDIRPDARGPDGRNDNRRDKREPREARPHREPRPDNRGGRTRDHGTPYRNHNAHQNANGPRSEADPHAAKASAPYPISGNPVVYCTKTGKIKNNPVNLPRTGAANVGAPDEGEKRVNILQKIGSTVSSIFSKK